MTHAQISMVMYKTLHGLIVILLPSSTLLHICTSEFFLTDFPWTFRQKTGIPSCLYGQHPWCGCTAWCLESAPYTWPSTLLCSYLLGWPGRQTVLPRSLWISQQKFALPWHYNKISHNKFKTNSEKCGWSGCFLRTNKFISLYIYLF